MAKMLLLWISLMDSILIFVGIACVIASILLFVFQYKSAKRYQQRANKHFIYKKESDNFIKKLSKSKHLYDARVLGYYTIWLAIIIPLAYALTALLFFEFESVFITVLAYEIFIIIALVTLRIKRRKFINTFNKSFIVVLDAIIHDLRAGRPILMAIENVGLNFNDEVGKVFKTIYHNTQLGVSLPDSIDKANLYRIIPAFAQFSMIIKIHHKAGSDPTNAILSLINIMNQEELLKKRIDMLAMDGRISVLFFSVFPLIIFAILWNYGPRLFSLDDNMMMALFTTATGRKTLYYIIITYVIGLLLVFRSIKFKY
jgi:Flp pilus assembly protein TadB